ncbi:uncharacterized protein (DUF1015 family) [Roseiarcus fermentans]|uniref:Uncharacterized protein (DUF1015 family) n=1 Tax=Roseiarcus fermentans TaxID=1473586 RepID=A0A366ERY7_9HYPH|nr:DUF1015 family protein [Roseiarcus fermentans]RBP05064.1 uncharacterized protein (DUF1015 family) [Roseiarcus fermentans]
MTLIKPFRALRPAPGRAAEVLAPPYDVLSSAEARERAKGKPWSFLHVSKAEIDLDPSIDPYDPAVYARAAENLKQMIEAGALVRDARPCYYAYRLTWRGHVETGFAAVASLAAYAENRIRKHELTTHAKEDDRVRQIEAVGGQTGPVMLAYPEAPAVDAILARAAAGAAEVDVTADDGVRHELWPIDDEAVIADLGRAVDALPALYIADGHHRSAAALRVAQARGLDDGYFLAVLLPEQQMTILDYNRALRDLNGLTPDEVLREIGQRYTIEPSDGPVRPGRPDEVGMALGGRWFRLALKAEILGAARASGDPVARLPVTLLAKNVIEPVFGVTDPRRDKRIDFVGGGRGLEALERLVSSGTMAVAFALYPTRMSDLIAVADAGRIMPPKSTWFEPKLADGMVSHMLD